MKTHLYFVQAGYKGPIKIGIAGDVCRRIAELQTGNHNKLNLIAAIPIGTKKKAQRIERWLHGRFRSKHIRGEWFQRNIQIKTILEHMAPDLDD
jgi:predicted GIY-YIG superfamily endonuclease